MCACVCVRMCVLCYAVLCMCVCMCMCVYVHPCEHTHNVINMWCTSCPMDLTLFVLHLMEYHFVNTYFLFQNEITLSWQFAEAPYPDTYHSISTAFFIAHHTPCNNQLPPTIKLIQSRRTSIASTPAISGRCNKSSTLTFPVRTTSTGP